MKGAGGAGSLGAVAPMANVCCKLQQCAPKCFGLLQELALALAALPAFLFLQERFLGRIRLQESIQLLLQPGLQLLQPVGR